MPPNLRFNLDYRVNICYNRIMINLSEINVKCDKIIAERKDKIIFRSGDATVKLFDENFSKSNVLNEAINQSRVEETGLNIPKIREVTLIDGKWAIVMDYVEGETLENLITRNAADYENYLNRFVEIQRDVHSRKHLLLTKFSDKMTLKIMNSDLDASTRYDLAVRLADMPKYNCVCHGDFNPSNVIVTNSGATYILDWSHASQGNPTADATKTYLIFLLVGEEKRANDYLGLYCEKTGTPLSDVEKWIPLVSAAQLVKANPENKRVLCALIDKYGE